MNVHKAHRELLKYCAMNNLEVIRGKSWCYFKSDEVIIEVWRNKPSAAWIYSMLHELGHFKINKRRNFQERSWKIFKLGGSVAVDLIAAFQIMREEIEAWEEGFKLAKKLGIVIDRKEYDQYSAKFIMKYMKAIPVQYEFWKNFKMADLEKYV